MLTLIDLPYAPDALAPVISAQTLSFHHGKHLRGYVDTLNKLLADPLSAGAFSSFAGLTGEPLLIKIIQEAASGPVFNNAGQILNHNLYFTQFGDAGSRSGMTDGSHSGLDPESPLCKQIAAQWGSLEAFEDAFVQKGVTLFGSGWVWLAAAADGTLQILQCPGADNPVAHGLRPILTFDVWEHAYYLDWQNRRPDHLKALWGIIDWKVVASRY